MTDEPLFIRPSRLVGVDGSADESSGQPDGIELIIKPQFLSTDKAGRWFCSHCGYLDGKP